MSFVSLRSQLERAESTLDLAFRLGRICVKSENIRELADSAEVQPFLPEMEAAVEGLEPDLLLRPDQDGGFSQVLDYPDLKSMVENLEASNPVEHLAFLRGMLPRLRTFYDDFEGQIAAKAGMPLPIVGRGINRIFRPTPRFETCGINDLLENTGFYLFELGDSGGVPVILDFGFRDRLDELTWGNERRLPKIATIHPSLGIDGIMIGEETDSSFFDVRPRKWEGPAVLEKLREVAGEVAIALLPELSLPAVDAMEAELGERPDEYPPIVVAGSAHVRETLEVAGEAVTEVRANESRIYLDGQRVSAHRKIHPYELRQTPQGAKLAQPMREALTREQKSLTILTGDYTRLGVVICADLNDRQLPLQLEDALVNLLLVPALTPDPGGFNGGICTLASWCQGVSVIANADDSFFEGSEEPPFTVMVGVPRSKIPEQSREYAGPGTFPAAAVIDPNKSLDEALEWRP